MNQPWYHSFKPPILVGAVVGAAVATLILHIGWKLDLDGDFHDETGVYWGNLFLVGIFWLVMASWPVAVIFGLVQISIGALCRRSNKALQLTRAAEPNEQSESAGGGPRS